MGKFLGAILLIIALASLSISALADSGSVSDGGITLATITSIFFIILIMAVTAYFTLKIQFLSIRLIVIGVSMIFIGIVIILYGNSEGGSTYILLGVGSILLGTIVLLVGNMRGGAFNKRIAKWLEDVHSASE